MGVAVVVAVVGLSLLGVEAYFRLVFDQPQNLGPYAANNWYVRHGGDLTGFRGASAQDVAARRVEENDVAVVVIGDSYVWGQGVEARETFSTLLEKSLGVRVLPAGKRGWATRDELD